MPLVNFPLFPQIFIWWANTNGKNIWDRWSMNAHELLLGRVTTALQRWHTVLPYLAFFFFTTLSSLPEHFPNFGFHITLICHTPPIAKCLKISHLIFLVVYCKKANQRYNVVEYNLTRPCGTVPEKKTGNVSKLQGYSFTPQDSL